MIAEFKSAGFKKNGIYTAQQIKEAFSNVEGLKLLVEVGARQNRNEDMRKGDLVTVRSKDSGNDALYVNWKKSDGLQENGWHVNVDTTFTFIGFGEPRPSKEDFIEINGEYYAPAEEQSSIHELDLVKQDLPPKGFSEFENWSKWVLEEDTFLVEATVSEDGNVVTSDGRKYTSDELFVVPEEIYNKMNKSLEVSA